VGFLNKLSGVFGRKMLSGEKLDVSETVSEVAGGGILGIAVGELAEEVVKATKKKKAK
jgi:hypothetical protein